MVEIIISVILYLSGAVTEYETDGKVTQTIMYSDANSTLECKKQNVVQ